MGSFDSNTSPSAKQQRGYLFHTGIVYHQQLINRLEIKSSRCLHTWYPKSVETDHCSKLLKYRISREIWIRSTLHEHCFFCRRLTGYLPKHSQPLPSWYQLHIEENLHSSPWSVPLMDLFDNTRLRNFSEHIPQLNSEPLVNILLSIIFQQVFIPLAVAQDNLPGHNPDPVFMHIWGRDRKEWLNSTRKLPSASLLSTNAYRHITEYPHVYPRYDCSWPIHIHGYLHPSHYLGFFTNSLPTQDYSRKLTFLEKEIPPSLPFKACIVCLFIGHPCISPASYQSC